MKRLALVASLIVVAGLIFHASYSAADPCGMVPPIFTGEQTPIARQGLQKTYVFYKDGVETFVIRPGFTGNVDNFGMLIPFPSPPSLRKVPDDVFEQVANSIDPPEVVFNMMIRRRGAANALPMAGKAGGLEFKADSVQVLKQEAVGMYEVAVLQAGSAAALKKWMDDNGFQYPTGMDKVTNEYIEMDWCFVAVKTKVANASRLDPRPGQRQIRPELPKGSVFDGFVQGMGFRFRTEELVVPMRLSAFNDGDLRNIVYLLTDEPKKIRSIPEEYVVRQLSGKELIANMTRPLPLRIIGGTLQNIPEYARENLKTRRQPGPKNGKAKELFASDLIAIQNENLSLAHEEMEKELLAIGEHFGLRGASIDNENAKALVKERARVTDQGLQLLEGMTMTVVDGDFPRDVIANENLRFAQYQMPPARNTNRNYDAKLHGPSPKKTGVLELGDIDWRAVDRQIAASIDARRATDKPSSGSLPPIALNLLIPILGLGYLFYQSQHRRWLWSSIALLVVLSSTQAFAQNDNAKELIEKNCSAEYAKQGFGEIVTFANASEQQREAMVEALIRTATNDESLPKRGWAIAAMAEIGGQDVDEYLLNIHADEKQEKVVRTWAAAARVTMTRTLNGLIEKANLIQQFPALGRPIGLRIVEKLGAEEEATAEQVLQIGMKLPQLQSALAPIVMGFGPGELMDVMFRSEDNNLRRSAAAYLGTLANQNPDAKVTRQVVKRLEFSGDQDELPWGQQALFIPGVKWEQEEARQLVGGLIRWMLWSDRKGNTAAIRQIHNNIRSLALARAAGYQSPGWRESDIVSWLNTWKQVVGKEGILQILKEQNVEDDPKYQASLN